MTLLFASIRLPSIGIVAVSLVLAACTTVAEVDSTSLPDSSPSVTTPTPPSVDSPPAPQDLSIDHWEMVVVESQPWTYASPTEEPNPDWKYGEFRGESWKEGSGGIGYGDDDDRTSINPTLSVYLHTTFEINALEEVAAAVVLVDYDDGFVAYLNGSRIAANGIGSNGAPPSFDTPAEISHEAQLYSGGVPEQFSFDARLLKEGTNHLAVQVHNRSADSSDLSARVFVALGITSETQSYLPTPPWFEEPFVSSNLPLFFIDTSGQTIVDDPRIIANLRVVNNGEGQRNYLSDAATDYNGRISIEYRGATSQNFPKKPFGFETQNAAGDNNNVALLGLPKENDWVLHNPYSDKSLMRNALTFEMGRAMGRYAPRTKFCEVFLNGEYLGVYVLMEKIKRDSNRVNIAKLDATMNDGDALTGGYIIKIDKLFGSGGDGWQSPFESEDWLSPFFQFTYPKFDEITDAQKLYIEEEVSAFEAALAGDAFVDLTTGYRSHIDVSSFIDFMIIQELSRNVDGYRLSTFLYKDRDSLGGKLSIGPLWDFNLAFGNADYREASEFNGWAFNPETPFWWARFQQDIQFNNELRCRWEELRASVLSDASIGLMIARWATLLEEAQQRNFRRWPVLGVDVWPNAFVGETYAIEVQYLEAWVNYRADWLDDNFPGTCLEN